MKAPRRDPFDPAAAALEQVEGRIAALAADRLMLQSGACGEDPAGCKARAAAREPRPRRRLSGDAVDGNRHGHRGRRVARRISAAAEPARTGIPASGRRRRRVFGKRFDGRAVKGVDNCAHAIVGRRFVLIGFEMRQDAPIWPSCRGARGNAHAVSAPRMASVRHIPLENPSPRFPASRDSRTRMLPLSHCACSPLCPIPARPVHTATLRIKQPLSNATSAK